VRSAIFLLARSLAPSQFFVSPCYTVSAAVGCLSLSVVPRHMTLIEIESYKLVVTNSFASEIESQRLVTPADLIALDSSENERRERGGRKREESEVEEKAFFFLGLLPLPVVCFTYR
jgi:hypothetical protein